MSKDKSFKGVGFMSRMDVLLLLCGLSKNGYFDVVKVLVDNHANVQLKNNVVVFELDY